MDAQAIIYGVGGLICGAVLLLFPSKFASKAKNKHAARLTELEGGSAEAHFEELRALRAYPPPSRPSTVRLIGGTAAILGGVTIALYLIRD